ncbi:uncharacterized protein LY79DRAFT_663806 [Colletotrichum navitas]|uniref:Uncharacterized protein n=1 Tax=Colletotrichum navitas TaxID=681940 RepID=A0AAD8PK69_9PEZI|nr:uncharacterized protein LY79DRAFT_663806 [Colletotrichum navitas]KAK1566278.1 hypothetical protein LY79DRAFT_663806 [Colletotrichum navitas]
MPNSTAHPWRFSSTSATGVLVVRPGSDVVAHVLVLQQLEAQRVQAAQPRSARGSSVLRHRTICELETLRKSGSWVYEHGKQIKMYRLHFQITSNLTSCNYHWTIREMVNSRFTYLQEILSVVWTICS